MAYREVRTIHPVIGFALRHWGLGPQGAVRVTEPPPGKLPPRSHCHTAAKRSIRLTRGIK